ncbi:MAG: K+/H+ antiporter subunit F, partial [Proteobacteria bacterium]
MMAHILLWAIMLAQVMIVVAMACYTYRLIRGPR